MSNVTQITDAAELEKIIEAQPEVVIKFSAESWCIPCRQLKPHYEIASDRSPATFVSVDLDDNEWAMVDFGIKSVPTIYLYRGGTYDKTIVGRTVVQILNELS